MPYTVHFDPSCNTLYSAVSGKLDCGEIAAWEAELYGAARTLEDGASFQFIDDLRGYEVADQDLTAHKELREVTPRFLAAHGFVVGFFKLYEATPPEASESRRCTRVVHLHHDENKMARYREVLGTDLENFFSDADRARDWLLGER